MWVLAPSSPRDDMPVIIILALVAVDIELKNPLFEA
jgi:hypothetical protein